MSLSAEARERLADIVELQPTKNKELKRRWGMESGSDVHRYLENELRDYYYRDEDSLIRATAEGEALATGEEMSDTLTVHMSDRESDIFAVVPGPDERPRSVVSILHALEDATGTDYDVGDVRRSLRTLSRKGVVETVQRTVPTYRLAVEREAIVLENDR